MVAIFSTGKQWLRRSISAVLLLLFALSITPKKVLHDMLVDHQDNISYHHKGAPTFNKSGFHCDTEHNVAESPFKGEEPVSLPEPLPEFFSVNHAFSSSLHSTNVYYFTLRGPPAIV